MHGTSRAEKSQPQFPIFILLTQRFILKEAAIQLKRSDGSTARSKISFQRLIMTPFHGMRPRILFVLVFLFSGVFGFGQPADTASIQLYAMDCGHFDFPDLASFSDTGEYDHQPGSLADPCFLIHHPKGWLLWDTGFPDTFPGRPSGASTGTVLYRSQSLASELKMLHLTPAEIAYVGFSHLHFDHSGNANLFLSSTWLLQRKELDFATAKPTPFGVDPSTFSSYQKAKLHLLDGDYDVFGDGTVRILAAPGHTPGHQVLLVKLRQKGFVILSGDAFQLQQNRSKRLVPAYNSSRAETLASMDRIERLAKNLHATVIVQHSVEDAALLPAFPEAWQ
jgi:glyoxylase-like metal-dependent hydrolase (beta-lactamase superfamily II)